jgi:hypothetical protein
VNYEARRHRICIRPLSRALHHREVRSLRETAKSNQTFRFTIKGKPEVYCSTGCRDLVFFGDTREAKKRSMPGKCPHCGAPLKGKRRGALYCDENCKKRAARLGKASSTAEPQITGTATQLNQRVAYPKTAQQGDRIAAGPQPFRSARSGVGEKLGSPGKVEEPIPGSHGS